MAQMIGQIVEMGIGFGAGAMQATAEHDLSLEQSKYYTQAAADEIVAGADREQVRREQIRKQLGQQVTTVAKSGVTFSGSPLLALGETLRLGEEDMLALRRENRQRVGDLERAGQQARDYAEYIRKTGGFSQVASKGGSSIGGFINSMANRPSSSNSTVDVTNRTSSTGVRSVNEGRTQTVTKSKF